MKSRKQKALDVRIAAAKLAYTRPHAPQQANGEESSYHFDGTDSERGSQPSYLANYTKGLPHSEVDGLICNSDDYQLFVKGINSGDPDDFKATPLGPKGSTSEAAAEWKSAYTQHHGVEVRAWESAGAGLTFDLEGPDAQAVALPPAPTIGSDELTAEIAEVYEMALLRDIPFSEFDTDPKVAASIKRLNKLKWFKQEDLPSLSEAAAKRRRGQINPQNAFRGNTFGDTTGPYISQFLTRGTPEIGSRYDNVLDGRVAYGAIAFRNRVRTVTPKKDYMTSWEWWLDVQNGADLRGTETYSLGSNSDRNRYRYIATPRDLATYVHYDALYQAYLNACLAMLSLGVPFDPGVPFQAADRLDHQQGFAQFGGPHVLSLVTEVATRALKAVRYQKFNIHRRLRPEAIAGRIHQWRDAQPTNLAPVAQISTEINETLQAVKAHNKAQNDQYKSSIGGVEFDRDDVYLLPMAFAEGSPMHPSYGAGHATVAGACVTILKAFFDHSYVLPEPYVVPSTNGQKLQSVPSQGLSLTIEGELNKLASNISIGRDWAGVHYFTDYYESVRMGEQVALGILEEQKLTYGEDFSMTVPLFDGGTVQI
ncbi:vanadium-dependent haloperoxidase [cf. Phormidesmis sp. LEGE 11477]|uniref:vanadium-dependent haloperoxidase n=1 Tax=cf. Phormidesmis sp. LEGE 11477 TaxID=1828680 RepID=UPI00187F2697|nr:vanadium-dependent haloperoxidase [cf. Phormidesmis sp. LEGE 11477]MBE9059719.1 vanadium-dependent haloperoxidase [cf. Phormidesmis sp. LEGE 11477]